MLERTLAAEGYGVAGAGDGGAALAAVERSVPDLLVLDVGLPGLDGLAVCRRLRGKGLGLVWGGVAAASPNVVDRYVSYLRRKLGDPPLIQTVRGVGFVFERGPGQG